MFTTEVVDNGLGLYISNQQIHEKHQDARKHPQPPPKHDIQKIYQRILALNNEYNQIYESVDECDCLNGEVTDPVIQLKQRLIEEELDFLQDIIDSMGTNEKK